MSPELWFLSFLVLTVLILAFVASRYKKVRGQGWAIVVNSKNRTKSSLNGTFLIPIVDTYEDVRVTDRIITVVRKAEKDGWKLNESKQGLSCKDGVRVNITACFYIKFPSTEEAAICNISNRLTAEIINCDELLAKYFGPILNETLKNAVAKEDYEDLIKDRHSFAQSVTEALENQLQGLELERVAIDEVQHSPLDSHDPENIFDSKGREKIIQVTSTKMLSTKTIEEKALTDKKKLEVDGAKNREQLVFEQHENKETLRRNQALLTATENSLIALDVVKKDKELNEATIDRDTEFGKAEQQKKAAIDTAAIDVQRRTRIGTVSAKKEGDLAEEEAAQALVKQVSKTAMEKETSLLDVAEVTARRITVQRQSAVEEEETKDLRTERNVERLKVEAVGTAEATAQATAASAKIGSDSNLLVVGQDAEARVLTAKADLDVSNHSSEAKERDAKASVEIQSASGLASARVTEAQGRANAIAIESKGLAEAKGQGAVRDAMKVDPQTRQHELDIMELGIKERNNALEITSSTEVGIAQAHAMGTAYSGANVTLFGNNNDFANSMMGAKKEAMVSREDAVIGATLKSYDAGTSSLVNDAAEILKNSSTATDLLNLALVKGSEEGGAVGSIIKKLVSEVTKDNE